MLFINPRAKSKGIYTDKEVYIWFNYAWLQGIHVILQPSWELIMHSIV